MDMVRTVECSPHQGSTGVISPHYPLSQPSHQTSRMAIRWPGSMVLGRRLAVRKRWSSSSASNWIVWCSIRAPRGITAVPASGPPGRLAARPRQRMPFLPPPSPSARRCVALPGTTQSLSIKPSHNRDRTSSTLSLAAIGSCHAGW